MKGLLILGVTLLATAGGLAVAGMPDEAAAVAAATFWGAVIAIPIKVLEVLVRGARR